jgi:hypothetical protein
VGRVAELGSLGVIVRATYITRSLLAVLLTAVVVITGCATRKMAAGIGEIVVEKVATEVLLPPFVLSITAGEFHQAFGRWPTNYTELSAYRQSACGVALTNYDRVDFTPTADGGLEILALAKGMTNRMTLSLPNESQK